MTDPCEYPGCTKDAIGFGERIGDLPNRRRACREHADLTVVFQQAYGYVDRDEAETHVRETIAEAMDALNELAEFDGLRGDVYLAVAAQLVTAFDAMRKLAEAPL